MADEATTTPPADDAAQLEQADTQTPQQDDTTDWVAEARKWEKRAKDNSAAAKQNAAAAKRLAELEDANKTETQRLSERATKAEETAATWQEKYTALAKRQAITQAATDANTTDAETVYLYLASEVELDDDGKPVGLDKAMRDLAKRKPHLFRDAPAGARDAFSATPTPPALNSNALEDAVRAAVGAQ